MRPGPRIPKTFPLSSGSEQQVRRPPREASGTNHPIALDDPPRQGQQERHRQVGRGLRQDTRCVGDDDPSGGSRGPVDVVDPDGVVGDDAQPRGAAQDLLGDRIGNQSDQGLRLRHFGGELELRGRIAEHPDLEIGRQGRERRLRKLPRDHHDGLHRALACSHRPAKKTAAPTPSRASSKRTFPPSTPFHSPTPVTTSPASCSEPRESVQGAAAAGRPFRAPRRR